MASDQEYDLAVEKGTRLLQLLLSDDSAATQSVFSDVQDLEAHGYTGSRSTSCTEIGYEVIDRLSTALQALGVDDTMACDGGNNYGVDHKHTHTRIIDGVECPATWAEHTQICNHADGVLIAHSNHSAPHVAALQDPPILHYPSLHYWSDVAYLQWLTTSTFDSHQTPVATPKPAPIKYIFRLSVQSVRTYPILNKIMAKLGRSGYDAWPGVTFDIESEEGKAILGTPNGAGTAWLLTQRKKELGRRRIAKVTVFHAGIKEDMYGWPSLLFWIV